MVGNLASLCLSKMRNGQSLLSLVLNDDDFINDLNYCIVLKELLWGGGVPVPAWSGIWAAVKAPRAAR